MNEPFTPLRWHQDSLQLLDQTRLPVEETWLDCETPEQVADAIRRLAVRGAPAIGVAAAYGLVLGSTRFDEVSDLLGSTRPTAVNLRWALDRGRQVYERNRDRGPEAARQALLDWAHELHAEDVRVNRRIGEHGAELFAPGTRVLTHCNAGALATAGYGTAIGVIQSAWEGGKVGMVWVDETRPLLQGARRRASSTASWWAPTGSPPTATRPTRSAPTRWRSWPTATEFPSTWRRRSPRSTAIHPTARRSRSRSGRGWR